MKTKLRTPGFYKVNIRGHGEIALWNGSYWYIIGTNRPHIDTQFRSIDETLILEYKWTTMDSMKSLTGLPTT